MAVRRCGYVYGRAAAVLVGHLAVKLISVHRNLGLVVWQLMEVGADAIALRVVVGERAAQQHLVG